VFLYTGTTAYFIKVVLHKRIFYITQINRNIHYKVPQNNYFVLHNNYIIIIIAYSLRLHSLPYWTQQTGESSPLSQDFVAGRLRGPYSCWRRWCRRRREKQSLGWCSGSRWGCLRSGKRIDVIH